MCSVLVRDPQNDQFTVCVKGSPEAIAELCVPESVPADYRYCYVSGAVTVGNSVDALLCVCLAAAASMSTPVRAIAC